LCSQTVLLWAFWGSPQDAAPSSVAAPSWAPADEEEAEFEDAREDEEETVASYAISVADVMHLTGKSKEEVLARADAARHFLQNFFESAWEDLASLGDDLKRCMDEWEDA
jgi:hypothetical protein